MSRSNPIIIDLDDDSHMNLSIYDVFTTKEDPLISRSVWDITITINQLLDLKPKKEGLDLTAMFGPLRTDGTYALDLHKPPDDADELMDDMYEAFIGTDYEIGKRSDEYTRTQVSNLLRFSRNAKKFIRRGYGEVNNIVKIFSIEFDDNRPKSAHKGRIMSFINASKHIPREALLHENIPWKYLFRNTVNPSDTTVQ